MQKTNAALPTIAAGLRADIARYGDGYLVNTLGASIWRGSMIAVVEEHRLLPGRNIPTSHLPLAKIS